jgi:hypothetical protein
MYHDTEFIADLDVRFAPVSGSPPTTPTAENPRHGHRCSPAKVRRQREFQ